MLIMLLLETYDIWIGRLHRHLIKYTNIYKKSINYTNYATLETYDIRIGRIHRHIIKYTNIYYKSMDYAYYATLRN